MVTDEDTPLTSTLPPPESCQNSCSYRLASGAVRGRVALRANGTFTYSPDVYFNGVDSFTYYVVDNTNHMQSVMTSEWPGRPRPGAAVRGRVMLVVLVAFPAGAACCQARNSRSVPCSPLRTIQRGPKPQAQSLRP